MVYIIYIFYLSETSYRSYKSEWKRQIREIMASTVFVNVHDIVVILVAALLTSLFDERLCNDDGNLLATTAARALATVTGDI